MIFIYNFILKVFLNFRIGVRNLGIDIGKLFLVGNKEESE